jgi:hypothetical protein
MRAVAERLGVTTRAAKPDGYWHEEQTIPQELLDFVKEQGTPGCMPTQLALARAGRNDLAIAISRYGGGWTKMAANLGLELAQMPKDHWSDIRNVRAGIEALNV